jgi:hypothetical protein
MRVRLLSLCGGENDGSVRWGGFGNRDSENVEVVCGVRPSLESERSVEGSQVFGGGGRCGEVVVTIARWEGKGSTPVTAGGLGSLFRDLK